MKRDNYVPKTWSMNPGGINLWGSPPPLKFLLAGTRVADR